MKHFIRILALLVGLGDCASLRARRATLRRIEVEDTLEFQRKCEPYMSLLEKESTESRTPVGMMKLLRGQEEDLFDDDSQQAQEKLWCIAKKMAEERSKPGGNAALLTASSEITESQGPHPFEGRKNVQWLHLHNYGGTFICQEAARQGERTTVFNCNWDNCTQQTGYFNCSVKARSERYTFNMLERNMQPDDICSEAISGTMLRDPLSGMQSTMNANKYDKETILEILRSGNGEQGAEHTGCLPPWDSYQHFDNFATRSLSSAYLKAPGAVTREDLEMAKQRLRDMDVVMILEQLGDHLPQLRSKFGWDVSEIHPKKKANSWKAQMTDKSHLEDSDKEFLRQTNALDYELYSFAQQVAHEKTEAVAASAQL